MKALTGLPTQAYVQVSEEAKVPLSDLLRLVQELETGATPAYLARHRPDVSSGLDDTAIRRVLHGLREQLDLAERRIVVLTAIARQERLTDELRAQIEQTFNRRALEDIYLPYKPKRRSAADEAVEHSLEPLARFIWAQEPPEADISVEAAKYLNAGGPSTAEAALEGACEIIARWLGENAEIRRDVREIARGFAVVRARANEQSKRRGGKDEAVRKRCAALDGMSAPAEKIPWRQGLTMRRGAHDGHLELSFELPKERILAYLHDRLVKHPDSAFTPYLETAARKAYQGRLAEALENEVRHQFEESCDTQAVVVYERNLRRLLTAPAAGAVVALGIEAARPGGWRVAVVDAAGRFVEGGILQTEPKRDGQAAQPATTPEKSDKTAAGASVETAAETAPLLAPQQASEEAAAGAEVVAAGPPAANETETTATEVDAAAASEQSEEPSTPQPEPPVVPTPEAVPAAATEAPPVGAAVATTTLAADIAPVATTAANIMAPEAIDQSAGEQSASGSEAAQSDDQAEKSATVAKEAVPAPETPATTVPTTADVAAAEAATTDIAAPKAVEQSVEEQSKVEPADEASAPSADAAPKGDRERPPNPEPTPAVDLADLIVRHNVVLIVAGNGPGVRGVERFVRSAWRGQTAPMPAWTTVPEAGTWIYATSKSARKELPRLEPALRSAVCLARRAQDPLHEMAKMDPRVLGIGQGHHEVEQRRLRAALGETVESCIAHIGLDVNRSSLEVLALAPGMTPRTAKRIVEHRGKAGPYSNRKQLARTAGINRRVWDQAGGFLRVFGGENPLDETGIHPNHYKVLETMLSAAGLSAREALDHPEKLGAVDFEKCLEELDDKSCSEALLRSLIAELRPETRNPRRAFKPAKPTFDVAPLAELKVGIKVEGVVTNVTAFGVFVDIGAEHDGLAHVSRLASEIVAEGKAKLKAGDRMTVYVTAIEEGGSRISLSSHEPRQRREPRDSPESARRRRVSPEARREADRRGPRRSNGVRRGSEKSRAPIQRTFGPDSAERAREEEKIKKLSIDEKLNLLGDRFRTKV